MRRRALRSAAIASRDASASPTSSRRGSPSSAALYERLAPRLTEALERASGPRRGAEEITRWLNLVFDALTVHVHQYHGSVITLSGDAITCWFDQDNGLRAVAAALAMQQAIAQFARISIPPDETVALTMKVAIAAGPVRPAFGDGLDEVDIPDALDDQGQVDKDAVRAALSKPAPDRLLTIAQAFRFGLSLREIQSACHFDPWFLEQVRQIVEAEEGVRRDGLPEAPEAFLRLKKMGFSDARLGQLTGHPEPEVAAKRRAIAISRSKTRLASSVAAPRCAS